MRTNQPLLNPKPVVHVAFEGASEGAYLNALAKYRYGSEIVLRPINRAKQRPGRHTSLRNLIDLARRFEKESANYLRHDHIWIICDSDPLTNAAHRQALEKWLDAPRHHAAIQDSSLEGWLVLHFEDAHPYPPHEALERLKRHLRDYKKGAAITAQLIANTDTACQREQIWSQDHPCDGVFPGHRCSQLPAFIAFLDDIARQI